MIETLHYITQDHPKKSHAGLCREACMAGVKCVQLRLKDTEDFDWEQEAVECKEIVEEFGAKLIINDNVEVAQRVFADGVHLGQQDMSVLEARSILGNNILIGGTANTIEDIEQLYKQGADYIGLGPFKFTSTKKALSPILGLEGYRSIVKMLKKSTIPILGIGGIELEDIPTLLKTGIHGIALSGLITHAENKPELVKQIKQHITEGKHT